MNATENILNFRLRLSFWAFGALLGFSQAWTSRLDALDHTVSYLDMGSYFFHGHHSSIINGFWSPLYALLLSLPVTVLKPSMYWEYPTVHLIVFLIFLFTMGCFDYFLRQLAQFRSDCESQTNNSELDWVWITIGYTLFLWSSTKVIGVDSITPEMLVAAFFYLSCGLLVVISSGRAGWGTYLSLGVTLGLTYLTKFSLLPICVLILAIAWLAAKQKSRYIIISAIALVAIAAPFIASLSAQKGRITYGERVVYDYATSVNRIQEYHWQGDSKMPLAHPTREILASPAAFEFKAPFQGTYPPEYDISYWYEGIRPQLHFRQQMSALTFNLFLQYKTVFYALNGVFFATLFLAFYETGRGWLILKDVIRYWFFIVPSIATAVLFALVYYSPEYLAGFFVVTLLCLFSSATFGVTLRKSRLLCGVSVLLFVVFFCLVGFPILFHGLDIHPLHPRDAQAISYQQVAVKAVEMGLRPGDQIASLNYANEGTAMWARLARVQIIAEIYHRSDGFEGDTKTFWDADPLTQEKVIQKFSQTGARAVISQDKPSGEAAAGWSEIGKTGYYLYWLKPAE
jgi:hypothetical protein